MGVLQRQKVDEWLPQAGAGEGGEVIAQGWGDPFEVMKMF